MQLLINSDVLFIVKQVSIRPHADESIICDRKLRCNNIMLKNITKPLIYHTILALNMIEKLGVQCENSHLKSTKPSRI